MRNKNKLCLATLILLILLGFSNCFLFKQEYSEKLLIEKKIGSGSGELSWKTIDYLPTGPTSFGINNRKEIFVLDSVKILGTKSMRVNALLISIYSWHIIWDVGRYI